MELGKRAITSLLIANVVLSSILLVALVVASLPWVDHYANEIILGIEYRIACAVLVAITLVLNAVMLRTFNTVSQLFELEE